MPFVLRLSATEATLTAVVEMDGNIWEFYSWEGKPMIGYDAMPLMTYDLLRQNDSTSQSSVHPEGQTLRCAAQSPMVRPPGLMAFGKLASLEV